jgi:hypothetical protein
LGESLIELVGEGDLLALHLRGTEVPKFFVELKLSLFFNRRVAVLRVHSVSCHS